MESYNVDRQLITDTIESSKEKDEKMWAGMIISSSNYF